jgi:excisionase family DNA binding protein
MYRSSRVTLRTGGKMRAKSISDPHGSTGNLRTDKLDRLVTIDELSTQIRTPKDTIYGWCHRRIIPYYKLGKRSLFDPVEVLEWLEARRVDPVGGVR